MKRLLNIRSRWRSLRAGASEVLSMNQRNLHFIYPSNERRHFPLADNKLLTKQLLSDAGVPVPHTHKAYSYFFELMEMEDDLKPLQDFVVKPAQGRGGGGIIVIKGRQGGDWLAAGGSRYSLEALRKHISDIVFGVHSFGLGDQAIIESRLVQHAAIEAISPYGLADVRVIAYRNRPVMAMMRVPTAASDGKANLHQGALGIGIDLDTGHSRHAIFEGGHVSIHPDTGADLLGLPMPDWTELLCICERAAAAVPLKYLGIDLALTVSGPVVLEINVRPGIEIQNANMLGLRSMLLACEAGQERERVG